jgi:hypothetical protein
LCETGSQRQAFDIPGSELALLVLNQHTMQKKQVTRRTMKLNRETINVLNGEQLRAVQGGWGPSLYYHTQCSTQAVECDQGSNYCTAG